MNKLTFYQKLIRQGVFNPPEYLVKLYKRGMSCKEIAEKMQDSYNITITDKTISDKLKPIITLRSKSESKLNAIKRGRMIYYRKSPQEKYATKSISAFMRSEVLRRDGYKCTLCGNSPKTGYSLELHHVNGGESSYDNLETLCFLCHRGLHSKK